METTTSFTVGIVGATGAVGQELLRLLEERSFPIGTLRLFASARSAGKTVEFKGRPVTVEEAKPGVFANVDVAFFAAGGPVTRPGARCGQGGLPRDRQELGAQDGPERPARHPRDQSRRRLSTHKGIIANPELLDRRGAHGLWPLHKRFGLKRFVAASYQSVTGAGAEGERELEEQVRRT
jgi:aspartate-semialdehyde dehydrogenase